MHRLYADKNFLLFVVEELRRLEHDVLTMYEDGKSNQSIPDNEVLALAQRRSERYLPRSISISFGFTDKVMSTAASLHAHSTQIIGQGWRIAAAIEIVSNPASQLIDVYYPA